MELGLMLDAGYSTEQAVKFCTANGANLLGLKNFGTLTPGMPANFIAAKGGLEDIPKSLKKIKVFRAEVLEG